MRIYVYLLCVYIFNILHSYLPFSVFFCITWGCCKLTISTNSLDFWPSETTSNKLEIQWKLLFFLFSFLFFFLLLFLFSSFSTYSPTLFCLFSSPCLLLIPSSSSMFCSSFLFLLLCPLFYFSFKIMFILLIYFWQGISI